MGIISFTRVLKIMVGMAVVGNFVCKAEVQKHKVAPRIEHVYGVVNNDYAIIKTTIEKETNLTHQEAAQGTEGGTMNTSGVTPGTIVTRSQIGLIGPERYSSTIFDVELEVPTAKVEIETYDAARFVDKIGQCVGAVGIKMGQAAQKGAITPEQQAAAMATQVGALVGETVVSGIAAIADYAKLIAEEELNALYGGQQYRITLLEIIPTRYYTIDTETHMIQPTARFWAELGEYDTQVERYLAALKGYQDAARIYAQWYEQLEAYDPAGDHQELWKPIRQYDKVMVQPALDDKNKEENKLSKLFPPYRIAIMASPLLAGTNCGSYGSGPWELQVMYYVGAEQTNKASVSYCVPNPKKTQIFTIELMQNAIQRLDTTRKDQRIKPGGIQVSSKYNATFAQSVDEESGDYGADKTQVLNWFTKIVTHGKGGDIAQLMIPFDLYALRASVAKKLQDTRDAKMERVLSSMDSIIKRTQDAKIEEAKQLEQAAKSDATVPGDVTKQLEASEKKSADTEQSGKGKAEAEQQKVDAKQKKGALQRGVDTVGSVHRVLKTASDVAKIVDEVRGIK